MAFTAKYKVHSIGPKDLEIDVMIDGEKTKARASGVEVELVSLEGYGTVKLHAHSPKAFEGWDWDSIVTAQWSLEVQPAPEGV